MLYFISLKYKILTIVDGPDLPETHNRYTNTVRDGANRETM